MNDRFPIRQQVRLPRVVYQTSRCFFITVTTHERHPWFAIHTALADDCVNHINTIANERQARVYAWCIMPDHVHLLAQDTDTIELVRLLKGRATPSARRLDPKRRLWQRSFYDHGLRREESVVQVAQYIFENPVAAKLVETPPAYRWTGSSVWPDWRAFYGTSNA